MEEDIHSKTKKLINELNYFMVHVMSYFVINLPLMIYIFMDIGSRWWIFLVAIAWSLVLIYHSLRVYGTDPLRIKNKGLRLLFSYLLKLTGV
ncbi:2TM domain-containing protein [Fulvivirga lutea]|uniref:2TM domain-containing protein n=2 Tax=Fulvivirga lutea TaxID=2810512 RepID=A0A974WGN0_9BACT|nr:2TM domain-containing protein [Fulvivirga lutea]